MPSWHIVRVAPPTNEDLRLSSLEIQHGNLRVLDVSDPSDGKQDGFATGQELGPKVIAIRAGPGEHRRFTTRRRNALQSCLQCTRRENDRPVWPPSCAAWGAAVQTGCDRERRTARDCHSFQRDGAVEKPDPFAVR